MIVDYNAVFIFSDQPTQCPKCGNRTEVIFDLSHSVNQTQIHECLTQNCRYQFVMQKDSI